MSAGLPFDTAHVSALASRAAELERIGEEIQDPTVLVRAARLYTLAVRITDEIEEREALPFLRSDLSRVREELRTLAADTAAKGAVAGAAAEEVHAAASIGEMTRLFREIAVRIEQRLDNDASRRIVG